MQHSDTTSADAIEAAVHAASEVLSGAQKDFEAATAAYTRAMVAVDRARAAIENPKASDDPATLIKVLADAETGLKHAMLLAEVSARRVAAARHEHTTAWHRTFDADHAAAIEGRIAAAGMMDAALAAVSAAEEANAEATRALNAIYAQGYPRKFDGGWLMARRTIAVGVTTEVQERGLWSGEVV